MALWGILYTIVPLLLVGGLILAGAGLARKDEYDPRRTYVVYLLSTIFVSLLVLVAGVTMLVGNIAERVTQDSESSQYLDRLDPYSTSVETVYGNGEVVHSSGPGNDVVDRYNTAEAIQAALVSGVALLLLYFHARRLPEVTRDGDFAGSLLARTYSAYLYLVCFATVITAVVAAAVAIYALVRVAAPGSVGTLPDDVERDVAIVDLVQFGALAGLTALIFKWHWKAAEALRPGATV